MKRFIGLCLALVGIVLVLWGAYYCMTGQMSQTLFVVGDTPISAMIGGLAGLAVFTTGLLWTRD